MRLAFAPSLPCRGSLLRSSTPRRLRNTVRCVSTAPVTATIPVGKRMCSAEIRNAFLDFYEQKNHRRMPSASLVPKDPSILLTIAGMVPFKSVFMGLEQPPTPPRVTSSQKCIRTNDIENVGVTKRHHTFFEMLGNFSFGDYFKHEAIQWAWELLTKVYQIPAERLVVSVFEDDDEALVIWRDVVGVSPNRIQKMGAKDNFWAAGPTGPCGPCSEIYFDFEPMSTEAVDLENEERFLEVYNLVFMENSRDASGSLAPLENKNIDTGMGLERMAQILQQVDSNYETDLIEPIMSAAADVAGISYATCSESERRSLKVVGDHARSVAHLVADGVRPSNIGRGYIVRRLIRRIVRHGRLLGIDGPFIAEMLPVVTELADDAGLDGVRAQATDIAAEVTREEERFLTTLLRGESRLEELLQKSKRISGADAFELYDTFGFPLELTEEIARERDTDIDHAGFDKCMEQQRERARAARDVGGGSTDIASALAEAASATDATRFDGYERNYLPKATVAGIVLEENASIAESAAAGDKVRVLLSETPFYAEGGGQVGDNGRITTETGTVSITDTFKQGSAFVHAGEVTAGTVQVGDLASAAVDARRRRRIQAHHTATHLLQAALRDVVDESGISQAGSLVDGDRLRFDFNCPRALTADEVTRVEEVVNGWIGDAHATVVSHMSLDEAKTAGAVAMFGEKYDADEVRVVDVPGVSMELCGGTHVTNTADIGLFKIVSESGPAAGVRRIEAVCGAAVLPYLQVRDAVVKELTVALKAKPDELPPRVAALQDELRSKSKELESARAELAVAKALDAVENRVEAATGTFVVAKLEGTVSADSMKKAAGRVMERLGNSCAVVLAAAADGKVSFVAAVDDTAQKGAGIKAGKLVGEVAKVCGGGGGGRPNLAQAGGRDASKLDEAMKKAEELLREAFNY